MQLFNKLQGQYQQLWKYIIRPTRTPYPQSALGPQTFTLQNIKIKRNSFQLLNDRGNVFFGSHFVPLQSNSYPCVIYLHGNSSNQTEGMQYLSALMKNNISLCTFDFAGCGNSQGQYVTLGYNEWKDLQQVVMHVRAKQKVTKIAIWGRSMGAVTAIRYAHKHPQISAAVYDSPFKSLKSLIGDLTQRNSKIPKLIVNGALKIISSTIKQKAKFDIYELNPLKNQVGNIKVPAFFIVGKDDQLIPYQHTQLLYDAYKAKKKYIRIVNGLHNDTRPQTCIKDVVKFLKKILFKQQNKQNKSGTQSPMKSGDIDFFNDDLIGNEQTNIQGQNDNQRESKIEVKKIDFFEQQSIQNSSKGASGESDFKQFEFTPQNIAKIQENSNTSTSAGSSLFSLNEIFSGMFGGGTKTNKNKQINDGYQQCRNRILNSASQIIKNNRNAYTCKEQQQKIERQLKNRDNQFQKMFIAEPQQFVW